MGKIIDNVPIIVVEPMAIWETLKTMTHLRLENIIMKSDLGIAVNSTICKIKAPN